MPIDKQVLLVSGGESLDPNARVCSYSSGTDTNPIFLFSKYIIESQQPPTPSLEMGNDFDMKDKVGSFILINFNISSRLILHCIVLNFKMPNFLLKIYLSIGAKIFWVIDIFISIYRCMINGTSLFLKFKIL